MKALITGASSGIGRDIAKELSKKGYDVILVAREEKKLQEVAQLCQNEARVIVKDLSMEENCKELYEELKNEDIDILINNAGFGVYGTFAETNLDTELSMIRTNVVAMHILMKLFLQDMNQRGKGRILNVSSSAGFMPGPLMSSYYASKAYILRLSEGVREELNKEKSKVTISVLCPGPVRTNFNKVAGVNFGIHSLSSQQVANYAVKKLLKGKFMIVPRIINESNSFFYEMYTK